VSGSAALSPARFFEPDRILKVLAEHGVRYVLVGGIAATLRGSPSMTYDIDVAPELSSDNLERLADALRDLGAVRYTEPDEDIAEPHAAEMSARVEQFASPIGYIDVLRELRAIGGYARLIDAAELIEVAGTSVYVAALDDIIASKEAAAPSLSPFFSLSP
jgi:hypothetical protein